MKVCSLYGAGFYYIPGTDICMKVGGYIRWQETWNPGGGAGGGSLSGSGGRNTRTDSEDLFQRSRAIATFDTRQQTAYGTLRTYLILGATQDSTNGTLSLYANRAFIQIAGFTFGKATSFFDFVSTAAVAYNAGPMHTSDTGDNGHIVAAYTAQFGNGVSATIAAEEARRASTWNTDIAAGFAIGAGANPTTNRLGSGTLQDIVGNIRIDQAWGSAQVSAALHDASGGYYGTTLAGAEVNGHPDDKWGWAISGGLRLNTPMIGPGDYFQTAVVYTEGAIRYAGGMAATAASPLGYSGNSVGWGGWSDSVFGTHPTTGLRTEVELTTAWSIFASYEHFWTPSLRTSLYGSYVDVSHNANAQDLICNTLGGAVATGCNGDFQSWNIGSRSQWNIQKDLYVGLDVIYMKLNSAQADTTGFVTLTTQGAKPAGTYTVSDQDAFAATWRIHRDIVP